MRYNLTNVSTTWRLRPSYSGIVSRPSGRFDQATGSSDWSTQPVPKTVDTVWFRVQVRGADCLVESSFDGHDWPQLRLAHLAERAGGGPVSCGLYACSPKAAGFDADFHYLTVAPVRA